LDSEKVAELWVLAVHRQPRRGARVEIGRLNKEGAVEALDKLYWYPETGNWNLDGMYWRQG
jgi:hypothetical protein